jgi:cell wall-associated NlpC family hydrolase
VHAASLPRLRAALLLSGLLVSSCSVLTSRPPAPQLPAAPAPQVPAASGSQVPAAPAPQPEPGAAIANLAAALIGTSYEFGGADLKGFDCSGLALFVHERVGISIPRTAAAQQRAARAVPLTQLRPGDLVFFRMRARGIDHVGIYLGSGRFVHAPHRGVAVSSADLSDGFFARHLVNAGRFWGAVVSAP